MKKYWLVLVVTLVMALPNIVFAASIYNTDSKPYKIQGRTIGGSWLHSTIYSRGTVYFRCRYGCEIRLIENGTSIVLESDEDIVISNGEMRIR